MPQRRLDTGMTATLQNMCPDNYGPPSIYSQLTVKFLTPSLTILSVLFLLAWSFIFQVQLIVNGQTGLCGDRVLKVVMVESKTLQESKLCGKVMVELVQAQL